MRITVKEERKIVRIYPQITTAPLSRAGGKRSSVGSVRCRAMRNPFRVIVILLFSLVLSVIASPVLSAREDSASLVFRKTAGIHNTRLYTVEKGDRIADIMRYKFGAERIPYSLIRRMNPQIQDLNKIYPGQRILFPVLEISPASESQASLAENLSAAPLTEWPSEATYRVKEGDSISLIILGELNVSPADALPTYRLIHKLNPDLTDPNKLQAGVLLRLPSRVAREKKPPLESQQATTSQAVLILNETDIKPSPAVENLFEIVSQVVSQMKGSLIVRGNYYIPLKDNAQVTIDCSLIPVVELDDGTTVLLDYSNRLSKNLKGMISQSWSSAGFLTGEELRDPLSCLQGIIRRSRDYTMVRTDGPLTLTAKPVILVFADWMISSKEKSNRIPYRQVLFFLHEGSRPMSAEARSLLEKDGLHISEISGGRPVFSTPENLGSIPEIADLKGLRGISLAERLLAAIGEKPLRNEEVVIFDRSRDGLSLSVTADLLLQRGEKRYVFHSKRLPEQFVRVLKEAQTEVIFCGDQDAGRPLIETLLKGIHVPISFGYFSLRVPEEEKLPRMTVSFAGLRITSGGEPLYLIDFDFSPDALTLFQSSRGGRVVRY